jgi:hypothetical protein
MDIYSLGCTNIQGQDDAKAGQFLHHRRFYAGAVRIFAAKHIWHIQDVQEKTG